MQVCKLRWAVVCPGPARPEFWKSLSAQSILSKGLSDPRLLGHVGGAEGQHQAWLLGKAGRCRPAQLCRAPAIRTGTPALASCHQGACSLLTPPCLVAGQEGGRTW